MRTRRLLAAAAILWALALSYSVWALPNPVAVAQPPQPPAAADSQAPPANTDCLDCHADDSTVRENGPRMEVVKPEVHQGSVHGELSCVDCHQDLAKAELPHSEKLQPADCSGCHTEETDLYKASVHVKVRDSRPSATCVDCHGRHDMKAQDDPGSRTHHLKVAETCATCHKDPDLVSRGTQPRQVTQAFADSIHGTVLNKSGLIVAPTCSNCHRSHDIRSKHDPQSPVALVNIGNTCGTCHQGVARQFHGGVHASMVQSGKEDAPACQTCHSSHNIGRSDEVGWQLSVINQCGTCHADRLATFRDTFHGQVTSLGSRSVAGCADCHGAHEVLPASDPRSPIAPANLVKTCGTCHENANANFVKYDPHADKNDRERHPGLFFTARLMTILLAGVFSMFGLHTILWFTRELQVKRAERNGTR